MITSSAFATTVDDREQSFSDTVDIESARVEELGTSATTTVQITYWKALDEAGFHQVFIDEDESSGTGYSFQGIGADYYVEYTGGAVTAYEYTGNGTSWSWNTTDLNEDYTKVSTTLLEIYFDGDSSQDIAIYIYKNGDSETLSSTLDIPDTVTDSRRDAPRGLDITKVVTSATGGSSYLELEMECYATPTSGNYYQNFIDTDGDYDTGYVFGDVGADILIEYNPSGYLGVYDYTGDGTSWSWSSSSWGSDTSAEVVGDSVIWTIDRNENWEGMKFQMYAGAGDALDYGSMKLTPDTPSNPFYYVVYYGWLNVTSVNWSTVELAIIADKNNASIQSVRNAGAETYMYIVYGSEYNNSDAWENSKKAEIDEYLAYNDGVFFDECDTGYAGDATNFGTRLASLVNYTQSQGGKAIVNGNDEFAGIGEDYYMFESFLLTWTGTYNSPTYVYANEKDAAAKAQRLNEKGATVITLGYGADNTTTMEYGEDGAAKYGFSGYYYGPANLQSIY